MWISGKSVRSTWYSPFTYKYSWWATEVWKLTVVGTTSIQNSGVYQKMGLTKDRKLYFEAQKINVYLSERAEKKFLNYFSTFIRMINDYSWKTLCFVNKYLFFFFNVSVSIFLVFYMKRMGKLIILQVLQVLSFTFVNN